MKLVYTFSSQYTSSIYKTLDTTKILNGYINYYRMSIQSALKVGYDVDFYISSELTHYFDDLKINIFPVGYIDSHLFDFLKAMVLKERTDEYLLIDGDSILSHKIKLSDEDILYYAKCFTSSDSYVEDNKKDKTWHVYYKPYINKLNELGIGDYIPEWTGKRLDFIYGTGILYFNNKELKDLYVDRWYTFNSFINENNISDKIKYTVIGAQYVLSEIINAYGFTSKELIDQYTEYIGIDKFVNPKVPTSYIKKDSKKSIL